MHPFDRVLERAMWFTVGIAVAYLTFPARQSPAAHDFILWALGVLCAVWMGRFYADDPDEDDDPYGQVA